ncbi:MAG: SDR family oxidoreductase [Bacteroidales bacterium]|jgi:NAD(P)-dependent dehydrogenase (short-subunit alcohol dehydrogenase family)
MNIVITGASNGIGFELAKQLSANSDNQVVGIARSGGKLQQLSSEVNSVSNGGHFYPVCFDLSLPDYTAELVPEILKHISTIDILINNAGLLINKPFEELTDVDFDHTFDVNVKAPFRLIRDLLGNFSQPAHVVNITSMGGVQGSSKFAGLSLYSSAKGALAILTECMAEELADKKICVNALALGAVQTEMLAKAFPGYLAPLSPIEMAGFIAEFALTGHHFFNGKILPVSLSTP